MSVEINVDGNEELEAYLQGLTEKVKHLIVEELRDIVSQGADYARQNAPVRTGRLRASIFWSEGGEGEYTIFATAPYAAYQEFGTVHIEPKLFMTKAWEKILKDISEQILGEPILE